MIVVKAPTPELRKGRRFIESLPEVKLIEDLTWFDDVGAWGMLCRLAIDSADLNAVPTETDWWVTVEESYPFGKNHLSTRRRKWPDAYLPALTIQRADRARHDNAR